MNTLWTVIFTLLGAGYVAGFLYAIRTFGFFKAVIWPVTWLMWIIVVMLGAGVE